MSKNLKLTVLAIAVLSMSGCAGIRGAKETNNNIEQVSASSFEGAQNIKSASSINSQSQDVNANFGRVNRVWVNPVPLPKVNLNENKSRLPKPIFSKKVDLVLPGKVSLVEVISELQRTKTVDFKIAQDIYNQSFSNGGKILSGGAGAGASNGTGNNEAGKPVYVNDFVFSGTLENALDLIAAKANISWKWDGNTVHIFKYETKTYHLSALAGKTDSNASVSLTGTTGGSGEASAGSTSSSGQSGVNRSSSSSRWEEIKSYLMSLTSPTGTIAIMEASGLVSITDTPLVHAKLEKAIEDLNKLLSKQIYINMEIYSVVKSKEDNLGIDWNFVWNQAGAKEGFTYTGTNPNTAQPAGSLNIGFLTGKLAGSSAIVKALSTAGDASIVNQFAITTLNGEPTPVSVNRKIAYIKKTKTTALQGSSGSASTEVEPGEVFTGIGMTLVPKIQPDGKILVEYALNLADYEGIKEIEAGGTKIGLPITTAKNILQRASLRSGQTLVLSGFKQNSGNVSGSGMGHPMNILGGGGIKGVNSEQYLVITMTPYIAQDNN